MRLFSQYVSTEFAETIWQQREQFLTGGRPHPQRLTATVLFTDLEGYTLVSEKRPPQALLNWLNAYMEAMVQQIMDRGGVINKYIGDAIMALFGVPLPHTSEADISQDAVNAVESALAMESALRELNGAGGHRVCRPLACGLAFIPTAPGIQRVRLEEHGVRLATGVLYQWFVALVRNPNQRSEDLVTGGTIERIPMPEVLRDALAQPSQAVWTRLYAEAGIWYDATAAVSALIEAAPQDTALRQQRAGLLEQVGLLEVAAYDRPGG
jgi:Domain of Unknown Function (DUF928)/Adenylate and Guanylate cyclase catalytic domain